MTTFGWIGYPQVLGLTHTTVSNHGILLSTDYSSNIYQYMEDVVIEGLWLKLVSVTTSVPLTVTLETVSTTTGLPTGVLFHANATGTIASPVAGWQYCAFTAPVTVSVGSIISHTIRPTTAPVSMLVSVPPLFGMKVSGISPLYRVSRTSGSTTMTNGLAHIVPQFQGGNEQYPLASTAYCFTSFTANLNAGWTAGAQAMPCGTWFTMPQGRRLRFAGWQPWFPAGNSNSAFTFRLYDEDSTVLAERASLDGDITHSTTYGTCYIEWPDSYTPIYLEPGRKYRVTYHRTAGNGVQFPACAAYPGAFDALKSPLLQNRGLAYDPTFGGWSNPFSGLKHWVMSISPGSGYCPISSTATSPTGDMTGACGVQMANWSSNQTLFGRWADLSGNSSYRFVMVSGLATLYNRTAAGATNSVSANSNLNSLANLTMRYLGWDHRLSDNRVRFWQSTTGAPGTWTQLGTNRTMPGDGTRMAATCTTAIGGANLTSGDTGAPTTEYLLGRIADVRIWDGIHDLNTADDSGDASMMWQWDPTDMVVSPNTPHAGSTSSPRRSMFNAIDGFVWNAYEYPTYCAIVEEDGWVEHPNVYTTMLALVNPWDPPTPELASGHFG